MPKTEPSAPGDHTNVDTRPDYRKSGLSAENLHTLGNSILRSYGDTPNLNKTFQKNNMDKAEEISDAVPRRGQ